MITTGRGLGWPQPGGAPHGIAGTTPAGAVPAGAVPAGAVSAGAVSADAGPHDSGPSHSGVGWPGGDQSPQVAATAGAVVTSDDDGGQIGVPQALPDYKQDPWDWSEPWGPGELRGEQGAKHPAETDGATQVAAEPDGQRLDSPVAASPADHLARVLPDPAYTSAGESGTVPASAWRASESRGPTRVGPNSASMPRADAAHAATRPLNLIGVALPAEARMRRT